MRRKASFTLLEMLLCMALIAIGASVGALAIPKFLAGERFEKEVKLVEDQISLAQELVIDCDCNVTVLFDQSTVGLKPSIQLPKRWLGRPKKLKEIERVAFDGEQTDRLELLFDGEVGGSPRGQLQLLGKRREATLYLSGYPGKIKRGNKEVFCGKNAPYPQEILSRT